MSTGTTARRRKPPAERRDEMVRAAAELAVSEGLEKVTAKSVAAALEVFPGLVSHYFDTADELVTAAFVYGVTAERTEIFAAHTGDETPVERMRRVVHSWLEPVRDPVSLLWLDAWQASRRRPVLGDAVAEQMELDLACLIDMIRSGRAAGVFGAADPSESAIQILSLIDGLSVQAATRDRIDYTPVHAMVIATIERILGLGSGQLS